MKKSVTILLAALLCLSLAACGGDGDGGGSATPPPSGGGAQAENPPAGGTGDLIEDVSLTVWGGEEDQNMLRSMIDEFIAANRDRVNLTVEVGVMSESIAKDTVLNDITAAADVFAFANDQIYQLVDAGALQEIVINTANVIAANNSSAVEAATVDGKLYAYPMTADNGYFMFYDASVFSADDVQSFDRMMEVAAAAGKRITMQLDGGWYNYSFFKGAGLNVGRNDDGLTNYCDWNGPGGTDVAQAMLDIAA
ncbi:MAG: extracellular solute-binding protein, partial [Oscillospiraceae bacterium]|nr:extracellular solute-binding protein [Oscillospiraceae bacterium]